MKDISEIVKQVLVPMFCKESQLDRSLGGKDKKVNKALLISIKKLRNKADKGTLKNRDIRKGIAQLSEKTKASAGQSQKVINVYLKYYCVLTNKPQRIIRELDCPLDGKIMSKFGEKGLRKIPLKRMGFETYVAWQNHLEKEGKGFRLKSDIETYDKERLNSFRGL